MAGIVGFTRTLSIGRRCRTGFGCPPPPPPHVRIVGVLCWLMLRTSSSLHSTRLRRILATAGFRGLVRGHTGPSFLVGEVWLHPLHPLLPMDDDDGIVGFTREVTVVVQLFNYSCKQVLVCELFEDVRCSMSFNTVVSPRLHLTFPSSSPFFPLPPPPSYLHVVWQSGRWRLKQICPKLKKGCTLQRSLQRSLQPDLLPFTHCTP